jgi:hypothetical protein
MVEQATEHIADTLKGIVNQNGPKYLTDEPYLVYTELIESGDADKKTAAALLHCLVNGVIEDTKCDDAELLSGVIRRECSLNKRMADRLSRILVTLCSGENKKEWKNKDREGLKQFLKEDFACTWQGFAVWDEGNGTVDCHYEATIVLAPTNAISEDKELAQCLKKNPFMTKDAIHGLFAKRLKDYLDYEFEEYCTEDDYYQPVVEDFGLNLEYDLAKWCNDNGFEFVSFEGAGDDGGYEPKFRKGWY